MLRSMLAACFWIAVVVAGLSVLPWWAGASAVIAGLVYGVSRICGAPEVADTWTPRPRKRDPASPE